MLPSCFHGSAHRQCSSQKTPKNRKSISVTAFSLPPLPPQVWERWEAYLPASVPRLYLYSRDDAIAPAPFIEAFVKRERAAGVVVSERVWGDSGHVEHYRAHPEEYKQAVDEFMAGLRLEDR